MSELNASAIKTVLTVYGLKKDKLAHQIYQVNDSIHKKKQSIAKFEEYAASYHEKCDSMVVKNSQMLMNHQAFYQNVAKVIASEQQDLLKLGQIHDELVVNCGQFISKIEGLEAMWAKQVYEKQIEHDKALAHELTDLAVVIKGVKKAWER